MPPQAFPARRPLSGGLPFQQTPAPVAGGSPQQIQGAYNAAYGNAFDLNRSNYQNILGGYQQTAADQTTANNALQGGYQQLSSFIGDRAQADQDDLLRRYGSLGGQVQDRLNPMDQALGEARGGGDYRTRWFNALNADVLGELGAMRPAADRFRARNEQTAGGYGALNSDVMATIDQIGRSNRTDIAERYAQDSARASMDLSRRGLGNSTVVDAMERAARFDRERADIDLSDRLAQTRAGYRTQLGLAGLGFQERAAGDELGQENLMARERAGTRQQMGQFGMAQDERQADRVMGQQNRTAQTRAGFEADVGRAGLGAYGDSMRDSRAQQAALGQARLGFGERANNADTDLAMRQLGFMENVQSPYPDAGMYAQLAQMSQDAASRAGGGFGGGAGGGGAGGMTTTRGGPWSPSRPNYENPGLFDYGTPIGPVGSPLVDRFGNVGPSIAADGTVRTGAQNRAAMFGQGVPFSESRYAPPAGGGMGGGSSGGAVTAPEQFDAGGATAGGGLTPGGALSESPYAPPRTGFGGGFGSITDPQQTAGGGSGLQPTQGTPYAPQGGGFGGGFGGGGWQGEIPLDWEFMVPVEG